ncbi:Mob (plasmid) [Bartonella schoenbuchensis m07a]|uniref:Mob n=2 Tax=Bartonella schoenbuchensis TaxID=165694 RepID=N6VFJ1_9HYPH|nr:Mob [Bartonella schoenbuchensis m07a]
MRCKKITKMGNVAAALKHCFRERETPNAAPDRTQMNQHYMASSTDEAMGLLREKLPQKRRKDAVIAVEYVMTASPQWWGDASTEQQQDFFNKSREWLAKKYGEQNILVATVHNDETSPHLSAFVVPITPDGRLSAKEFIGNRSKMSNDQTTFAKAVEHLGLQRGIERSVAKHQRVSQFYSQIQKDYSHPHITPEELKPRVLEKGFMGLTKVVESPVGIAERLTKKFSTSLQQLASKVHISFIERRRTEEMCRTAINAERRSEALKKRLKEYTWGLNEKETEQIKLQIKLIREQKALEAKQRKLAKKIRRDRGISF